MLAASFLLPAGIICAQVGLAEPRSALPAVQDVRVETGDPGAEIVVVQASGPLPVPRVGVLDAPPRVYLDFQGVTTEAMATRAEGVALVRRVRVAINQPDPVVTRVVIDLAQSVGHRVDLRERAQGRITVTLSSALPRAPAESPSKVVRETLPPPVRASAEKDLAVARAALGQLERLRPLLSAIDARTDLPEADLTAAIGEFETVRQTLVVRGSDSVQESLTKICVLGANAASTRIGAQQDNDPGRAWNAASAAAGALIMLDRARTELSAGAKKH